jgi:hypothetical protein
MVRAFGQVVVAAAGTPVRASNNQPDPTARVPLQSVTFQARPENLGVVFIFLAGALGASVINKTTRVTCVGFLAAPTDAAKGPFDSWSYTIPNVAQGLRLDDFWFDVNNNGDGVIVIGTVE